VILNSKKVLWIDYIRAFATILVILLHTTAPYLYKLNEINLSSWLIADYIDSFTRVSVPLFFMISGFLFFGDKKPKAKNYIKIYLSITFYSLISLIYMYIYQDISIYKYLKNIPFNPIFYHLWFFYTIFIIYIIANFIQIRAINTKHISILLFTIFIILNPTLSDITNLLIGVKLISSFQIDGEIIFYLLYAIFGAILGNIEFKNRFIHNITPLIYIISSIAIGYITSIISLDIGEFNSIFYKYNSIFVAIGAISIFISIKIHYKKLYILDKPIKIIAAYSLPIYGVHAIVLDYIYKNGYRDFNNPSIDIISTFTITIIITLIISMIIKKLDRYNFVS